MIKVRPNNLTGKIFDNILFLAEVFGDQADRDIPQNAGVGNGKAF